MCTSVGAIIPPATASKGRHSVLSSHSTCCSPCLVHFCRPVTTGGLRSWPPCSMGLQIGFFSPLYLHLLALGSNRWGTHGGQWGIRGGPDSIFQRKIKPIYALCRPHSPGPISLFSELLELLMVLGPPPAQVSSRLVPLSSGAVCTGQTGLTVNTGSSLF